MRFPVRNWLVAVCLAAALPQPAQAKGEATYAAIGAALKGLFTTRADGKPLAQMAMWSLEVDELKRSYRSLGLMNAEGAFTVKPLDGKKLLDTFDAGQFIDQMTTCANQNPYLSVFIEEMGKKPPAYVKDWSQEPKRHVAIAAVVYAKALDRLTRLLGQEASTLAAVREHYKRQWREPAFAKAYADAASPLRDKTNLFLEAKLQSVIPAVRDFVRFITGAAQISPSDGRFLIPLNISEAVAVDFVAGNGDNAKTGIVLAENPPGQAPDTKTQTGPSRLSKDKKAIEYQPPLPGQWADLYQSWNMAFVSQAEASPFLFAKLFTPAVACYEAQPSQYLYNRAIALYLHMHFTMMRVVDTLHPELGKKAGRPPVLAVNWVDPAMTARWGAINLASARQYAGDIECRSPGAFTRAQAALHETAGKAATYMRELTNDETSSNASADAASGVAAMKQLDQKAKEWGNWLVEGLTCALQKK